MKAVKTAPAPSAGYNFCLTGKSARKAQPVITAPRNASHCAWLAALTLWDEKFEFGYIAETSSDVGNVYWDTPSDGVYQIGYANQGLAARSFFTVTNGLIEFISQAAAVKRLAPRGVLERLIKRLEVSEPMTLSEQRTRKAALTLTRLALGEDGKPTDLSDLGNSSAALGSYAASGNKRGGDVVFHTLEGYVIASTRDGQIIDEGSNVPLEALSNRLEQEKVTLSPVTTSIKGSQKAALLEYAKRGVRASGAHLPRMANMISGLLSSNA